MPSQLPAGSHRCTLGVDWVGLLRIDAEFLEGLLGLVDVELAVARQARQRGGGDGFRIHLEVTA